MTQEKYDAKGNVIPQYADRVELARAILDLNEKFADGLIWKSNLIFHLLTGLPEETTEFYLEEVINP